MQFNVFASLAAWAILATGLPACSTAQVADSVPSWAGGEPTGTPARRAVPLAYPNVYAPVEREAKPLSPEEQMRLRADLAAAGQRQAARAKADKPE